MAHKLDLAINKVPQLEVGGLEGGQVLGRDGGVQIARLDARELGQVVHNL